MKKRMITLGLCFALSAGILMPPKAEGAAIVSVFAGRGGFGHDDFCGGLNVIGLLLLFPVCVLEGGEVEASGVQAALAELRPEDQLRILADQESLAAKIMEDQEAAARLAEVNATGSADALVGELRRIMPQVSDAYLHFVLANGL